MKGSTVKNVAIGIVCLGIVVGIIMGFSYRTIDLDDLEKMLEYPSLYSKDDAEGSFNFSLMLSCWISFGLLGFIIHLFGEIIECLQDLCLNLSAIRDNIPSKAKESFGTSYRSKLPAKEAKEPDEQPLFQDNRAYKDSDL